MNTDKLNKSQLQEMVKQLASKLHDAEQNQKPVTIGRLVMLQSKDADKVNAFGSISVSKEQIKALAEDAESSDSGYGQLEFMMSESLQRFWQVDPNTGKPAPTYFSTTGSKAEYCTYSQWMKEHPTSKKYRLAG